MQRVLRAKKGEPGARQFDYELLWSVPKWMVGVLMLAAIVATITSAIIYSPEKEASRVERFNKAAAEFNQIPHEYRKIAADRLRDAGIELNEADLVEYEEISNIFGTDTSPEMIAGTFMLLLLVAFIATTFFAYLMQLNSETVVHDGKEYIRRIKIDEEPVKHFIADFPEGRSKIALILVTLPFWPVYFVSWLRMREFKKNQVTKAGS